MFAEPCCGTAVMTLNNPEPAPREVICDLNAYICLEPGTPIWGADLHYRPVGTLAVGDKVMAFDEYSGGAHSGGRGCSRYRRWKVATVTATRRVVKRCFKLTMSDDTEFVCSAEHQWLTAGKRSGSLSWTWTKAADLVPVQGHGERCNGQSSYLLKPAPSPPQGHDFIDGWLGGMADGEGHMNVSKSMQLTIVQNPGRVQSLIAERLRAKGYEFSERPAHGTIATVLTGGSRDSSLRFLVEARPERLVDRFVERCGDVSIYGRKHNGVQLVEKQELGMREVVALETDSHTFIAAGYASHNCNFYRALRADPDAVAYWADWQTNHHDLTARHRWLLAQGPELRERMTADPDDFDPKIAGWWVWGQSSWIGHGWCDNHGQYDRQPHIQPHPGGIGVQTQVEDKRPQIEPRGGGSGVSAQRDRVPHVVDQMPFVLPHYGGQGVQQQRAAVPHDKVPYVTDDPTRRGQGVQQQRDRVPGDKMPHVQADGKGRGVNMQRVEYPVPRDGMPRMPTKSDGQGVAAQRRTGPGAEPRDQMPFPVRGGGSGVQVQRLSSPVENNDAGLLDGSRLRPWFRAIAERLARCIILNRSWESALTPSVLQQTPSSPKPSVGVFLDPPYRTTRADGGKRSTGLYQGDTAAASDDVAAATYAWALEHGDKYRVAYCMHEGDFPVPPGWTAETMGFSGHRDPGKKEKAVDQVIFSPACVPVPTDPQAEFAW